MHYLIIFVLVTAYTVFLPCATAQNRGGLNIRILDVSTGYSVNPERVEIAQREDRMIKRNLLEKDFLNQGGVFIPLPVGTYDITVTANGYEPMSSFFPVGGELLNVNFQMEPLSHVRQLTSAHIQALHREDAMVVVGFIVDDDTGKPLEDVSIRSFDNKVSTVTNESGYYQLILPLPLAEQEITGRNTILMSKAGFATESRKNFDMWPNGDMIMLVRMKRGQGIIEENVLLRRDAAISFK